MKLFGHRKDQFDKYYLRLEILVLII